MRGLHRRLQKIEEVSGIRYTAEHPRDRLRFVATGFRWTPNPGGNGSWSMPPLNLEKSTCSRRLFPDGTLHESVHVYGDWEQLREEDLERWIAKQPVERFGIDQPREFQIP